MTINDLKDMADTFIENGDGGMDVRLVLCQTRNNVNYSLEYSVGETGLDENGNLRLETGDQIGYAVGKIAVPW